MRAPHQLLARAIVIVTLGGVASPIAAGEIAADQRRSGYDLMSHETQAMQDDDTSNPGMLWVLDGEALWHLKTGAADKACADCHGEASTSMKGIAARYPAFDAERGRALDLMQRINLCRNKHQNATSLPYESKELLALTAYVARQSRGLPIADPATDERLRAAIDAGRQTFNRRQGQLNLACAQCHDDNWDKQLAGNPITQGQVTGYPLYRLEWQGVGSLQRRMRNCMIGMRAEPFDYGAPEFIDLELFMKWRARGLSIETPAVRP
jgi:L-cysteine S-thiosulfotransferase